MNPKAPDFRWQFANGFGFQMSQNEFMLTFGMAQDVSDAEGSTVEHTGIVLTPRSAKLLARALTHTISNWEKANGTEIEVAEEKLAEVADRILKGMRPPKPSED